MNFTTNNNGRAFRSAEGFVIRRDTMESPAYWKAYDPAGREIAGGAGDQGWLKCVEYARRLHALNEHAAREAQAAQQVAANGNSPPKSCESASADASPQQSTLL